MPRFRRREAIAAALMLLSSAGDQAGTDAWLHSLLRAVQDGILAHTSQPLSGMPLGI